jgi:hypothetical protein
MATAPQVTVASQQLEVKDGVAVGELLLYSVSAHARARPAFVSSIVRHCVCRSELTMKKSGSKHCIFTVLSETDGKVLDKYRRSDKGVEIL